MLALAFAVVQPAAAQEPLVLTGNGGTSNEALALAAGAAARADQITSEVLAATAQQATPSGQYQDGNRQYQAEDPTAAPAPAPPASAHSTAVGTASQSTRLALAQARALILSTSVSATASTKKSSINPQFVTESGNCNPAHDLATEIVREVRRETARISESLPAGTSVVTPPENIAPTPAVAPDPAPRARAPETRAPDKVPARERASARIPRPQPAEPSRRTRTEVASRGTRAPSSRPPRDESPREVAVLAPPPRPAFAPGVRGRSRPPESRTGHGSADKPSTRRRPSPSARPHPRAPSSPRRHDLFAGSSSSAGVSGATSFSKTLAVLAGAIALVALGSARRASSPTPAPRPKARGRPLDRPG